MGLSSRPPLPQSSSFVVLVLDLFAREPYHPVGSIDHGSDHKIARTFDQKNENENENETRTMMMMMMVETSEFRLIHLPLIP